MFEHDAPPFEPPPDGLPAQPAVNPAIGDVWCRKQYADVGNSSIGRVDVTDTFTLQGTPMVKFVPRYGAEQGKVAMMSVAAFKDLYVIRAASENPR